jgi:hypothetical protein
MVNKKRGRPTNWSQEQLDYLRVNAGKIPVKEMVSVTGKSYEAISGKAKYLHISVKLPLKPRTIRKYADISRFPDKAPSLVKVRTKRVDRMMELASKLQMYA